jgi:hypothetical protein
MIFRVFSIPAKVQLDSKRLGCAEKHSNTGSSRGSRSSSNGGATVSAARLRYVIRAV